MVRPLGKEAVMAFDSSFIDDLKARVDIVDVVGRVVQIKKAGSNYKGLCPFHNEKTPSFMVNEQKQIFICFGCGEKGDVIHFVQRYYNLSFMEAVEKLCSDYNIKMPEHGRGRRIDYDHYYEINRHAARFFFASLTGRRNPGYEYITGRGITDSTIRHFGLGYAPDSWDALYNHLKKNGVSDEDMLKLGLVKEGKKGGFYDKFRNRLMFPIFNVAGKVIGFGGRAIDDSMPKYLNSSESEIFMKKNNLFGLNFTKKDIADADRALLVEGYMDMISLYQNGVRNVAASLGTSLTENQGRLITRYTKNIVLSYDSDSAGVNAALRGIDIMKKAGANVRILTVSDGKDPDEFVRKNGREAFEKLIDNAVPAVDFRLEKLSAGLDLSDDMQLLEYVRRCVPVLRQLSPVERSIYVRKLSGKLGLSEIAIESEIDTEGENETIRSHTRNVERRQDSRDSVDAEGRTEISLIKLAMRDSRYVARIKEDGIEFRTGLGIRLFEIVSGIAESGTAGTSEIRTESVTEQLDPEEEKLFLRTAAPIRIGPDEEEFYQECRGKYLRMKYGERRTELQNSLAVAEKMGKDEDVSRIAGEIMEVEELIRKLR
jgi:DNA primase